MVTRRRFIGGAATAALGGGGAGVAEAREDLHNEGPGFERFARYEGASQLQPEREVYVYGSGPPVIVLHEIFGATPNLFKFAFRIADAGFTAYVPILVGKANRPGTGLYAAEQGLRVCLSREFAICAAHRSSPVTDWVRALGRQIHAASGGPGIGAVGLCLTGSFALTMMLDEWMLAPVVSEPSLPFSLFGEHDSALHMSNEEIRAVQSRVAKGAQILAFRFKNDRISPEKRYKAIAETFDPGVRGDGNLAPTCSGAHSVFTEHYDDRPDRSTLGALLDVVAFLREKLRP